MPTIEAQLLRELRKYALELRKLAYSLPHGVGENALLQLSERMVAAADQGQNKVEEMEKALGRASRRPPL
jgi:hypothetical protein